jgi:hypothetical protein
MELIDGERHLLTEVARADDAFAVASRVEAHEFDDVVALPGEPEHQARRPQ